MTQKEPLISHLEYTRSAILDRHDPVCLFHVLGLGHVRGGARGCPNSSRYLSLPFSLSLSLSLSLSELPRNTHPQTHSLSLRSHTLTHPHWHSQTDSAIALALPPPLPHPAARLYLSPTPSRSTHLCPILPRTSAVASLIPHRRTRSITPAGAARTWFVLTLAVMYWSNCRL